MRRPLHEKPFPRPIHIGREHAGYEESGHRAASAYEAARRIFSLQRVGGYLFDVEILRLAQLLGYQIKEIGIRWQDDGDSRPPLITGTIKQAVDLERIRMMRYELERVVDET